MSERAPWIVLHAYAPRQSDEATSGCYTQVNCKRGLRELTKRARRIALLGNPRGLALPCAECPFFFESGGLDGAKRCSRAVVFTDDHVDIFPIETTPVVEAQPVARMATSK